MRRLLAHACLVAALTLASGMARAGEPESLETAVRSAILLNCVMHVDGMAPIDVTQTDELTQSGLRPGAKLSEDEITQLMVPGGKMNLATRESTSGRVVVAVYAGLRLCRVGVYGADTASLRPALTKEFSEAPWKMLSDEQKENIHMESYGRRVTPTMGNLVQISGPTALPQDTEGLSVLISVVGIVTPEKPDTKQ